MLKESPRKQMYLPGTFMLRFSLSDTCLVLCYITSDYQIKQQKIEKSIPRYLQEMHGAKVYLIFFIINALFLITSILHKKDILFSLKT